MIHTEMNRVKWNLMMLYFDVLELKLLLNVPEDDKYAKRYESFIPTIKGVETGFLVWLEYTTYDSFGSYDEVEICVVDLYEDYDSAAKMATLIREHLNTSRYLRGNERSKDDIEKEFFYAAPNSDRKPCLPLGWGNSIKNIYVDYVEVDDSVHLKRIF